MSQVIFYPCVCTYIASGAVQDANYGTSNRVRVGTVSKGDVNQNARTLIHIDLSVLGAITVQSTSKLELYDTGGGTGSPGQVFNIYRVVRTNWIEEGVTWNKYDGTNAWTTAGCSHDGNDYSSTTPAVSTHTLPNPYSPPYWASWTGAAFAGMVQDAIDNRSSQFHVIVRWAGEESAEMYVEYESDDATSTMRPKLTIDYTGGNVPNIASLDGKLHDSDLRTPAWWTCVKTVAGEPHADVKKLAGVSKV